MQRRKLIKGLLAVPPALWLSKYAGAMPFPGAQGHENEPMASGPFKPDWESLKQYKTPEWFADAKFGMWAHWGAQCQPEYGDWYARFMYDEGSDVYKFHCEKYGHPSKVGFKDVIHQWKAEKWNPEKLVELYKKTGAQYFVAMANHHDNFDNYDSKYQPWNSVKMGPEKDLIGGWAKAAKNQGLRFGVSVHGAHAWNWYETAQRSDKQGAMAGIPYDGKLAKANGKDAWWNGLDPQDLYAQNHPLSQGSENIGNIHKQWHWGEGVSIPDKSYCDKFYNRTVDLINKYHPDLVYFDDTALPLWPISDAGLKIAAHMYNESIMRHGKLEAVINGKILTEEQRKCMVWDIEKGASNNIELLPWQTCTCIGGWHYDRRIYDRKDYKTARDVINQLVDVVSKNGNLLLNIPLRADGTIDEQELAVVEDIGRWMQVNGEAIFATRPWRIFGEGPSIAKATPLTGQGFNEGSAKNFTAEDIRFTTKGDTRYATFFGWPENRKVLVKSIATEKVSAVELLGYHDKLEWEQTTNGLAVMLPENKPCHYAFVLKII